MCRDSTEPRGRTSSLSWLHSVPIIRLAIARYRYMLRWDVRLHHMNMATVAKGCVSMPTCSSSCTVFGSAECSCTITSAADAMLGRPNFTCMERMVACSSSGSDSDSTSSSSPSPSSKFIVISYSCRHRRFLGLGISQNQHLSSTLWNPSKSPNHPSPRPAR
jgi:hypothetical protein